jgi:hypothetical protein
MERPNIKNYDIAEMCLGCDASTSEEPRYDRDLELWEATQQAKQDENFWMVAGGPTAPRNQHISYESAWNEAKRLAEKQPGTTFYVVRPITKILASPPKAVSTPLTTDKTKWL